MPRRIRLPDGTVHVFPDDATDAEIAEALGAPPATARTTPEGKARSWVDTAVDLLPMAGGTLGGIVGGIGGTAFGMGIGGIPGATGGAALGGAAGEALRQLANLARGEAPMTTEDAALGMAKQGAIQGGAELAGGLVAKGATKGAQAVYRGYLKPSLAGRKIQKANQIVHTALDEAIPISRRGTAKADKLIAELNAQVNDELSRVDGPLDLHTIAERVRGFARRVYNRPGVPVEDYHAALRVADSIDKHSTLMRPGPLVAREVESKLLDPSGQPFKTTKMVTGPKVAQTKVPATEVNVLKQSLDRSIGEANFGVERGATKTTQKVGRATARRQLERVAPQVAPLNAREAKLIDAAEAIKRAVERDANQNPLYGVKTLASIGVGGGSYATGDDPLTAVAKGAAMRGVLTPGVQSSIAIVANRIARELGVSVSTATRLATYVMSDAEQQAEQ